MTPEDFKFTLTEQAHRLRQHAIAMSHTHRLDEKTSQWLVKDHAWRDLIRSADYNQHLEIDFNPQRMRKTLLGLPVRVTVDDDPETPDIQLVMEPQLMAQRARTV